VCGDTDHQRDFGNQSLGNDRSQSPAMCFFPAKFIDDQQILASISCLLMAARPFSRQALRRRAFFSERPELRSIPQRALLYAGMTIKMYVVSEADLK
jgi:hypothetical protein